MKALDFRGLLKQIQFFSLSAVAAVLSITTAVLPSWSEEGVTCSEYNASKDRAFFREKIGRIAGFQNFYVHRYHELVIYDLCTTGDASRIKKFINLGYVTQNEVEKLRITMIGHSFSSPIVVNRDQYGLRYDYAYKKFLKLGFSIAPSSNLAGYYAKGTDSVCGFVSAKALEGDQDALGLIRSSDYCQK